MASLICELLFKNLNYFGIQRKSVQTVCPVADFFHGTLLFLQFLISYKEEFREFLAFFFQES